MTREEMLDEAVRRIYQRWPLSIKWIGDCGCQEEAAFKYSDTLLNIRAEFRRQYEMNVCDACGSTDKYPEHLCPAKPRAKPWQPSYRTSE